MSGNDPFPVGASAVVIDYDGHTRLGPYEVVRSYWPTPVVELATPNGMSRENHDRLERARQVTLARDITAADLAMDSPDPDEGYPADHVIGPKGSAVTIVGRSEDDPCIEVTGFANDPYVIAFVNREDTLP